MTEQKQKSHALKLDPDTDAKIAYLAAKRGKKVNDLLRDIVAAFVAANPIT